MKKIKPLARRNNIVIQEIKNETLIYDLNVNKAFNLNQTSAMVWQLSDGSKTVSEIAKTLTEQINSPVTEEFIWLALDQLQKGDLLENGSEIGHLFEGFSRREIIKRVGLSTVAALPVVYSLIAPMAIQAQSNTCAGTCQCPNATVASCSPTVGAATYPFCHLKEPTASCRCRGPFSAPGSGTTPTQKLGTCATS